MKHLIKKTRHQNYINSNIIKSELPNHFMRDFNIIIDHRQNSSTVTTLRSKPKYVYQKFIPEFVLSLLFGIKLVLFMFFYRLSNSLMPISFGTLLTMFYYLFNCFTLLSLFRPQLFPVFLQFHCPLHQKSLISWHSTNII